MPPVPHSQSPGDPESVFRHHPDTGHSHIRFQGFPAPQDRGPPLIFKMADAVMEEDVDPIAVHLLMSDLGHLEIQLAHDLRAHFHQGHLNPLMDQVLRQLQADEAPADDNGFFGVLLNNEVLYGIGIRNVPQGEEILRGLPFLKAGLQGIAPCSQDQLIVALLIGGPLLLVIDRHGLPIPLDGDHFAEIPDIQTIAPGHPFHSLNQKLLPFCDDPPDIVGEAAVSKGDIFIPFENDDFVAGVDQRF